MAYIALPQQSSKLRLVRVFDVPIVGHENVAVRQSGFGDGVGIVPLLVRDDSAQADLVPYRFDYVLTDISKA